MAARLTSERHSAVKNHDHSITVFKTFLLVCILNLKFISGDPLYSESDPILQLNATSLFPSILGQNTAFVIEFYNSWCGHCIRYAPVWKAFANDIQAWNAVVVVAAIDCAEEDNFNKCKQYEIPLFPTVKFFWTQLTITDLGNTTSHESDITILRHHLIDFLEKKWGTAPKHFPFIKERSETSIEELWKSLPKTINEVFVVVETSDSYIGKEVILDISSLKNVTAVRVTNNSESLMEELYRRSTIPTIPALLLLRRKGDIKTIALSSAPEIARQEFSEIIYSYGKPKLIVVDTKPRESTEIIATASTKEEPTITVKNDKINLSDLQNAIHYLLMQEVGMKAVLVEDDLAAFKAFLAALTKTYPGNESTMNFLRQLYQWVAVNNVSIQTNDMYNFIKSIQKSNEVSLSPMQEWVHCKGSKPLYRGYPCGLWTLFHTMTVQAYNKYLTGEMVNPQQVMVSIKGYILHFFSCGDCAKHFETMSMDMEAQLRHPNDTVIWLWQAHNKVNKRLSGDRTDDPHHPKVQFPPKSICAQCYQRLRTRNDDSKPLWNLTGVVGFLRKYYSDIKVDSPLSLNRDLKAEDLSKRGSYYMQNLRFFNKADISLCLILYVSSAVLLLLVYFVIILRRRKRKKPKSNMV